MAHAASPHAVSIATMLLHTLARPFEAWFHLMIRIAEKGPHAQRINRLNALTDADLKAMGTSRAAEVNRMFAGSYYM